MLHVAPGLFSVIMYFCGRSTAPPTGLEDVLHHGLVWTHVSGDNSVWTKKHFGTFHLRVDEDPLMISISL